MKFLFALNIIRPKQWIKNLMVFFPPFLSGSFFYPDILNKGIAPFLAFCFASSCSYVFNDIYDFDYDAVHPRKRTRPLASGKVSMAVARGLVVLLLILSLALAWSVSTLFVLYVGAYLAVSGLYTLFLKRIPVFDVFCISLGFVLRLYGGGEAFDVYVSDWLFLSVFLLSLFLSFGKRFSEQKILGNEAGSHRSTLKDYPGGFLESAMYLTGSAVLMTYAMYAINTPLMVYTVPLCVFGLLRYLMRIKAGNDGDPAEVLFKDPALFVVGVLWGIAVGFSVYR